MSRSKLKQVLTFLLTLALLIQIPVPALAAQTVDAGMCGPQLGWTLYSDGTLVILGSGEMYSYAGSGPWSISIDPDLPLTVIIQDGATSIGANVFRNTTELTEITIAATVTSISADAFGNCTSLETVTFEGNAPTIADTAFSGVTADAVCPAEDESWTDENTVGYGGELTWYYSDGTPICHHSFTVLLSSTDATCTEAGSATYKCEFCEETQDSPIEALGHQFTQYVEDGTATCLTPGTATAVCDREGCEETSTTSYTADHLFENYTPNNNANCTYCGTKTAECVYGCGTTDTITDDSKLGDHVYSEWYSNGDATCFTDGTEYSYCDICNNYTVRTDIGSSSGHKFTKYISDGNATCTEDGTKTAYCDKGCGATDTQVDKNSKTGHLFSRYISNNDATCTADGTKTAVCGRCKAATDTKTDIGTKLGHDYTETVVDPTCTEKGYTLHTCSRCSDSYEDAETEALGHSFPEDAYVSDGNADCVTDGTLTAKCERCDETDTITDEEAPALGHSFTDYVSNGDATCTQDGTETAKCDRCDETDTRTEEDSALGHSFTVHVDSEIATCVSDGVTRLRCSRCDEIQETVIPRDSNAHSAMRTINIVTATCTSSGYTGDQICDDCGLIIYGEHTPMLDHNWDEWTTVIPATYSHTGVSRSKCLNDCGKMREQTIPKLTSENPFTDVAEGSYYYDAVMWAVREDVKITTGRTPTLFMPDDYCLRAEVVTFLHRAIYEVDNGIKEPFVDVAPTDYFHSAVVWAVNNGITTGTDATHFSPYVNCTRAQVVTFLWRLCGSPSVEASIPFLDVSQDKYYYDAVSWAVEFGITNGTNPERTLFSPNAVCTRAQIVTFLYRCLELNQ